MTTTAYPPSIGGVQGYLADMCAGLRAFEPDVVTLWQETRTDWLLGTTLRLGPPDVGTRDGGVRRLGWSTAERVRMAPWVAGYYGMVPLAARHIAARMVGPLDRMVSPGTVIVHNHRIGREFLAMASLEVARRRGLPFVLTPYHHPRWHGYRYSAWTAVYRAADAVLALTAAEGKQLEGLGVSSERLHVIHGGADDPLPADAGRFRSTFGIRGDRPIVLFIGQLYEYKGPARLLAAADALWRRGVELDLVYIGPQTPFSRRLFGRSRRSWVHVLGPVDNQTKWDALEAAAVLCVPSTQESFGRVYLEAWAEGKPVIGCRIPAVSEVVTDGVNGVLVTAEADAGELPAALERLVADRQLARRMGEAGRSTLEERFTWPKVVARVESVYEGLLAGAPQRTPA
jgi:glycosyltransferase involved in cell wall biosynthesis